MENDEIEQYLHIKKIIIEMIIDLSKNELQYIEFSLKIYQMDKYHYENLKNRQKNLIQIIKFYSMENHK
jgi:predicted transposase YbfD/YdcC